MSVADLYHIRRAIRRDREKEAAPPTVSPGAARLCGICLARTASYMCPTCHAPYCSLMCFRAPTHSCAPSFAQRSVRENIQPDEAMVDDAERQRTLDILHRLQTGEGVLSDSDDSDAELPTEDELRDYTPEQLFRLLTLQERERFNELLSRPAHAAQLYFDQAPTLPWWRQGDDARPWARDAPPPMFLESLTSTQAPRKADLRFNLLFLLLAYTYVLRHLDVPSLDALGRRLPPPAPVHGAAHDDDSDGTPPPLEADEPLVPGPPSTPEADTARALLTELVPFLAPALAAEARLCLGSTDEVSLYLLQRWGPRHVGYDGTSTLLSLWEDLQPLVEARRVCELDMGPHAPITYALADLYTLFHASRAPAHVAAARKLWYYAQGLRPGGATEAQALAALVTEARASLAHEQAEQQRWAQVAAAHDAARDMVPVGVRPPRIEALD